jgi:peptidoglycan L-alanyl-D-glutamate endopeptidase CwlK
MEAHDMLHGQEKLATCRPELIQVFTAVGKVMDCEALVGHRGEQDQNRAVAERRSTKPWPTGEHNKLPSAAVDVAPKLPDTLKRKGLTVWNIEDPEVECLWWRLVYLILRTAERLGIKLRWGMDWDGDGDVTDTRLRDWPHWELIA